MTPLERPDPALVALEPPASTPTRPARREGPPAQLIPPGELALADFARHLTVSARQRTAGAYLDALQRLLGFGLDPLTAERSELERFLARNRRRGRGRREGAPSTPPPTGELVRLPPVYPWADPPGLFL